MNLMSFVDNLAAIDAAPVKYFAERCLHSLDKASSCEICFELCPVQAIKKGKPPVFDPGQCQSCLACLPVCPGGAFSANDAIAGLITCAEHIETPVIELVCSRNPQPELGTAQNASGLVVPGCLAGLGVSAVMVLAAFGFEKIIVRCEHCSECSWSSLYPHITKQLTQAQQLLAAWRKGSVPVICKVLETAFSRPFMNVNRPPMSRRDMFRITTQTGISAVARAFENNETTQTRQPGRERSRKLKAAFILGETLEKPLPLQKGEYFQLSASDSCTACQACVRCCPTQALRSIIDDENKTFKLLFFPQYCIGCGLCVKSCAAGALEISGVPDFDQVFCNRNASILFTCNLVHCRRCNTLFAAHKDEKFCPFCQFRQKNPFGSKSMPGIER